MFTTKNTSNLIQYITSRKNSVKLIFIFLALLHFKIFWPPLVGYAKSATDVDCPEETLNWHILTAGYRARWMDTYDEFAFGIRCCKFLVFGFLPN